MSANPFDIVDSGYQTTNIKKKKNPFDTGLVDTPLDTNIGNNNPFNTGQVIQNTQQPTVNQSSSGFGLSTIAAVKGFANSETGHFLGDVVQTTGQILGAPLHAVTKFFDSLIGKESQGDPIEDAKTIGNAFASAGKEFINSLGGAFNTQQDFGTDKPEQLSFKDLIKKGSPEFAQKHPIATSISGFIGDVALDPLTYVSFGAETGIKLAGEKLTNSGIDVVKNLNNLAQDGFSVTVQVGKNKLQKVIEFGPSEIEDLLQVKNFAELKGGALEGDKAALGKLNWMLNQEAGIGGKVVEINALTPAQRNLSVENNFLQLARSDTSLISKAGNLGLFFDIPFSPKRIEVIKPEWVDTVFDKLGISKISDGIKERLAENPIVQDLGEKFNRNYQLPQDYLDIRHILEGEQNRIGWGLQSSIHSYTELGNESKTKLTELAARIDTQLQTKLDAIQTLPDGTKDLTQQLSTKAVAQTRQYWLNQEVLNGRFTTNEFNVFGKFIEAHNNLANLEIQSRLFQQSVKNPNASNAFFNNLNTTQANLDLGTITALRLKTDLTKQAYNNFDEGLKTLFGTINPKTQELELTRNMLPDAVKRDLQLVGQSAYADYISKSQGAISKLYMTGLSAYKFLATAARPSFPIRHYVRTIFQGYAVDGVSAFKALDPRTLVGSMILMADQSSFRKIVPQILVDGVQKFGTIPDQMIYAVNKFSPDFVSGIKSVNRLGEKIEGKQLFDELIDNKILNKDSNFLDLGNQRNFNLDVAKESGFLDFQKAKWQEGYMSFIKNSIPWANTGGFADNLNRVATYYNARMLGYLPQQATEMTNKALFNYTNGLSLFESTVMKKVVPFYNFNRFAIPLVASLVKQPGKLINLKKTTQEFFEVWNLVNSGQQLTDSQRNVLPGLLIEQPNSFAGFEKEGGIKQGVFNTFNNDTFIDHLNHIHLNVDGTVNIASTIQKMGLAQITPILKVPLELLMDKNFFTDAAISKGGKLTQGDNLAQFERNVPDLMKHLMSYETRTDPSTGEKTGYINPYLSYLMQGFVPGIGDYINITKYDLNARESAMRLLGGIGTIKLDFQKEQHYRILDWQKKVKELQSEIRTAMLSGKQNVVNDNQEQLQQIIMKMSNVANLNVQ